MKKIFLLLGTLIFFGVTVFAGTLRITSPDGGERWQLGTMQNITWRASGSFANPVKLVLLKDGTALGPIVKDLDSHAGTFSWRAGEYHQGTMGGPLRTASFGSGYTIKIKEQTVPTSDVSNSGFTLYFAAVVRPDLQITNVFKDPFGNLGVRVKCLGGYRGNCLLRVENPNMPRGGFKQRMHHMDLRSMEEKNFIIGPFTVPEWAEIFRAERSICGSAYFTGIVDANEQIDEMNERNNSLRTRVYHHPTHEGQIVPPIGIGRFDRNVRCGQAITIQPRDVHERARDFVVLQVKVNVRNCGGTAISNGTLKFEQFIQTREGRGDRILEYRDTVHEETVNVEPGRAETYRPRIRLRWKYTGRDVTRNKLYITLLPAERGSIADNNHCNDIKLRFKLLQY